MKNKRIYTEFLLPNGDKIPISCRSEKELTKFKKEFPSYFLIKKSEIDPKEIKNLMNVKHLYSNSRKISRMQFWS
ncbi:hypothetical protein [Paenibacillus pini]|uniref:hypothetical protein n=1 Tax=Paenibacillus pini TaxID=669461 RepID=UPI000563E444|nr:hypothetical protein [Paenibacillus pini]